MTRRKTALSKPRIVISSYDDVNNPYYAGGGARSIREVADRLSHYFTITVLTGNYPGAQDVQHNDVTYKRIGPAHLGPKISQLLFHLVLPFYVRKLSFDVWIESFTPPFSTSCLQLYTCKPVIGLVHMLAARDMQRKYKLPFHFIENWGLKTYRYFISPTKIAADQLAKLPQRPQAFAIPNGVDKPALSEKPPSTNDGCILYIGRLEVNQKGLDLLLAAYASIAGSVNQELVIAGNGTAREQHKLQTLLKTYKLQGKVRLVGQVEDDQKWQLLEQCAMVVIPSRLETFNIVALEAMACGKPIVSFDIPGLAWIPNACVCRTAAFNTDQFGKHIDTLLRSKQRVERMSAAGLQVASNHTWDTVAEQYHEAIEHALIARRSATTELENGR